MLNFSPSPTPINMNQKLVFDDGTCVKNVSYSTNQIRPTETWYDNQAVTAMTKNPVFHNRTNHNDHFIHNLVIAAIILLKLWQN